MNLSKRNLIIIGSVFGVIIIALATLGFITQSRSNESASSDSGYVDPGSGEVIRSDKSPQGTSDMLKNAVIFPGFSQLINRGLSTEQIQSAQTAFITYSLENKKQYKEVSLQTDTVRHILPQGESTMHMMTFDVVINRTATRYVTVEYDNSSTKIKLYGEDRKTLLFER